MEPHRRGRLYVHRLSLGLRFFQRTRICEGTAGKLHSGQQEEGEESKWSVNVAAYNLHNIVVWCCTLSFFQSLEVLTDNWKRRLLSPAPTDWDSRTLALVRYFIDRYWLQAVSDYDLYSRVKFMVIVCLLLKELGGDFEKTAQLFSKEIENDADNMDALLDAAYSHPAFTDAKLLGMLL